MSERMYQKIPKKLTWSNTTFVQEIIRSLITTNPSFTMMMINEMIKETHKASKRNPLVGDLDVLIEDGIGLNKKDFAIVESIYQQYKKYGRISAKQYAVVENRLIKYVAQIELMMVRKKWSLSAIEDMVEFEKVIKIEIEKVRQTSFLELPGAFPENKDL